MAQRDLVAKITDAQHIALRELVRDMEPALLFAWIRHLYRCKGGESNSLSTVQLLIDLGAAADDAAMLVDDAMSDRLDRSARAKVENSDGSGLGGVPQ